MKLHKNGAARRLKPRAWRRFPQQMIAGMWARGMTISQIGRTIGRIDENPKDPYHSLRNCLHRMHKGYLDARGRRVRLPHRVSRKSIRVSRRSGRRAWFGPRRKG